MEGGREGRGSSWPSVPVVPCGHVVGGAADPCPSPFSCPPLAPACGY